MSGHLEKYKERKFSKYHVSEQVNYQLVYFSMKLHGRIT